MRGGKLTEHSAKYNEENYIGGTRFKQGRRPGAAEHASPLRAGTLLETVPEDGMLQVGGQKFGIVQEYSPNATRRSGDGKDLSTALRPNPTKTSVGYVADSAGTYTIERQSTE